jgi:hypothetical protein
MLKAVLLLLLLGGSAVRADTASHTYKKDEHVELWVNKVKTKKRVIFM